MGGIIVLAVLVLLFLAGRRANANGAATGGPAYSGDSAPPETSVASYSSAGDALDNFTQAIFRFEGGRPSNRNVVNNNPGNLKWAPGQSGTAGGFATFSDIGDGWDALANYVTAKASAHPDWNFYDFFDYYLRGSASAPSVDAQGNSDAYAEFVAEYVGVPPTTPVSSVIQQ